MGNKQCIKEGCNNKRVNHYYISNYSGKYKISYKTCGEHTCRYYYDNGGYYSIRACTLPVDDENGRYCKGHLDKYYDNKRVDKSDSWSYNISSISLDNIYSMSSDDDSI